MIDCKKCGYTEDCELHKVAMQYYQNYYSDLCYKRQSIVEQTVLGKDGD